MNLPLCTVLLLLPNLRLKASLCGPENVVLQQVNFSMLQPVTKTEKVPQATKRCAALQYSLVCGSPFCGLLIWPNMLNMPNNAPLGGDLVQNLGPEFLII